MSNGKTRLIIPRHNPINAITMGAIARDAGGVTRRTAAGRAVGRPSARIFATRSLATASIDAVPPFATGLCTKSAAPRPNAVIVTAAP